jgi:hypothetical protein
MARLLNIVPTAAAALESDNFCVRKTSCESISATSAYAADAPKTIAASKIESTIPNRHTKRNVLFFDFRIFTPLLFR